MLPQSPASESAPESSPIDPTQVLEHLRKLLSSRPLRESHQLQAFLEFIVQETLAGHPEELKESVLGLRVFGRRPDYDPRIDGIVRVQATVLRKRLEKYYASEGASDLLVIDLPRGGYVPVFRTRVVDVAPQPEPLAPLPIAAVPSFSWTPKLIAALAFALGCLLTAVVAYLIPRSASSQASSQALSAGTFRITKGSAVDCPQLWGAFFSPKATNLIAYGVPLFFSSQGLYFRDVRVNALGEGDQTYLRKFGELMNAAPQPMDDLYTGVGELEATSQLSNFFSAQGSPFRIVNARMIGPSELSGHNLAVISSLRFQTLLREMHLPEVFHFEPTTPEAIRNLKPLPGEEDLYVFRTGAGVSTSYALVSLWSGSKPGTRIMHVGGVHTWATQAAVEFLLKPESLRQIAAEFNKDKRTGARGPVSPFFQILLRVEGRGNQSQSVEYMTHHYLPQTGS